MLAHLSQRANNPYLAKINAEVALQERAPLFCRFHRGQSFLSQGADALDRGMSESAASASAPVRLSAFFDRLVICVDQLLACRQDAERGRVPTEVQEVVTNVGEQIAQERYEQIYNESSELWKKDVTLEQSNEVFKTLRTKLGKVEIALASFGHRTAEFGRRVERTCLHT